MLLKVHGLECLLRVLVHWVRMLSTTARWWCCIANRACTRDTCHRCILILSMQTAGMHGRVARSCAAGAPSQHGPACLSKAAMATAPCLIASSALARAGGGGHAWEDHGWARAGGAAAQRGPAPGRRRRRRAPARLCARRERREQGDCVGVHISRCLRTKFAHRLRSSLEGAQMFEQVL